MGGPARSSRRLLRRLKLSLRTSHSCARIGKVTQKQPSMRPSVQSGAGRWPGSDLWSFAFSRGRRPRLVGGISAWSCAICPRRVRIERTRKSIPAKSTITVIDGPLKRHHAVRPRPLPRQALARAYVFVTLDESDDHRLVPGPFDPELAGVVEAIEAEQTPGFASGAGC